MSFSKARTSQSTHKESATALLRIIFVVTLFFGFSFIPAHAATGLDYLSAQQNPDGSFGNTASSLATPVQTTAEVLRAYQALGQQTPTSAFSYLNNDAEVNTEFLARKIIVNAKAGNNVTALVNALIVNRNTDGGYSDQPGNASSIQDTAFALQALTEIHYSSADPVIVSAVAYLLNQQLLSGGFTNGDNDTSVYVTAQVMRALTPYRNTYQGMLGAIQSAQNYLLSQRVNGLWAEPHDTALALIALLPVTDHTVLTDSIAALNALQLSNASWANDAYTTALALQALALAATPPPDPTLGILKGQVVDAATRTALANVTVTLSGTITVNATTDVGGVFQSNNLAPGTYSVSINLAGYTAVTTQTVVNANAITDLGVVSLVKSATATTGTVRGVVTDAQTNLPVSGVAVSVSGVLPTVTDATGAYQIANVPVGTVMMTAAKAGYATQTGAAILTAGTVLVFSLALQVQTGTVTIQGRIIDGATALPLSGVSVTLNSSTPQTLTTSADGRFSFVNVPAGTYTLEIVSTGFFGATASLSVSAGSLNVGDLALSRDVPSGTGSVRGTITDAQTGQPLAGVSVSVGTATTTTDAGGAYTIANMAPAEIVVQATRTGYVSVAGSGNLTAGGVLIFSPALTPVAAQETALEGTVLNGATNAPLAGVAIIVTGASTVTGATDAQGHYRFTGLSPGAIQVTAVLSGYDTVSATGTLIAGSVINFSPRLYTSNTTPPDANTTGVKGVVLDASTNLPLTGVNITASYQSMSWSVNTDANGMFSLTGLPGGNIIVSVTKPTYLGTSLSFTLDPLRVLDVGQIRLRPNAVLQLLPDLIVDNIDITNMSSDAQTFAVSGSVTASVRNQGTLTTSAGFKVLAFYDANNNGVFDAGDVKLGEGTVSNPLAAGASTTIPINLTGITAFRDSPVTVWVDSAQVVAETKEKNNVLVSNSCSPSVASGTGIDLTAGGLHIVDNGSGQPASLEMRIGSVTSTSGPVSWWPGEGNTDDIADSNPGIWEGTPAYTTGKIGQTFQFNGSNQVRVPNALNLHVTQGEFTVAAWVKFDALSGGVSTGPPGDMSIVDTITGGINAGGWRLLKQDDNRFWFCFGAVTNQCFNPTYTLFSATHPQTGLYYYVVAVKTATEFALYVNGNREDVRALPPTISDNQASDLLIGANAVEGAHFIGLIDETKIYNRALSSAEILAAYNGNAAPSISTDVAFYDGDPAAGGALLGTTTVANIPANGYRDIVFNTASPLSGTRDIYAVVDPANQITECNENNDVTHATPVGNNNARITIATDKLVYDPNSAVQIMSIVSNIGSLAASYNAVIQIEDSSGVIVTTLSTGSVGPVSSGAILSIPLAWNVGTTLAGSYRAHALLYTPTGDLLDQAIVSFTIRQPGIVGPVTSLRVTTDKPVYYTTDLVSIDSLVANLSVSTLIGSANVRITVTNPSGQVIFTNTGILGQLLPNSLRAQNISLALTAAAVAIYHVHADLVDGSAAVLASADTQFEVRFDLAKALSGKVVAALSSLDVGTPQMCTDTLTNHGTVTAAGIEVHHALLNIDTQQLVNDQTATLSLAPGANNQSTRSLATGALIAGHYACALMVRIGNDLKTLAYAPFEVKVPPIRIDASLSLGTKGRLLVLLDNGRRGDDLSTNGNSSNQQSCAGVKQLSLVATFNKPLSTNATVTAQVTGHSGVFVDAESANLAGFPGALNLSAGSNGADLVLSKFTAQGIELILQPSAGVQQLGSDYSVEVNVLDGKSMKLTSGMIHTDCNTPLNSGQTVGAFTLSGLDVIPAVNAANYRDGDPYGPTLAPGLKAQRAFLKALLKAKGWSYTITDTAEDFTKELRTGGYTVYAVFAEQEKLDEQAQKELREAVFRGEGLLVAGIHDARNQKLLDALGIKLIGSVQANGVDLTTSSLGLTGHINLIAGDKVLRIKRVQANTAGIYTVNASQVRSDQDDCHDQGALYDTSVANSGQDHSKDDECAGHPERYLDAVITNTYGKGQSIFAGFDLLATATRDGQDSLASQFLTKALEHVHPVELARAPGAVVPLTLTLTNRGMATPATATINLPTGATVVDPGAGTASTNTLVFNANLAVGAQQTFTFWVRLPQPSGPVTFQAIVTAPNLGQPAAMVSYTVTVVQPESLTSIDNRLTQLINSNGSHTSEWRRAENSVAKGLKNFFPQLAIPDLLKATDALLDIDDPAVTDIRVAIDVWIRWASQFTF